MQRALTEIPSTSSALEASPTFNVVMAYEDFETGKHAKQTYDFLVEHLGHDCQFSNQMWKFNVLSIPKLRQMAAEDAARADIVIVSCHGDSELPSHVLDWLDSWVSVGGTPIALVALFDSAAESTNKARVCLAQAARRAGIEFFAQPDEWPGRDGDLQRLANSLPLTDIKTLSTLEGVIHRQPTPRWEINE